MILFRKKDWKAHQTALLVFCECSPGLSSTKHLVQHPVEFIPRLANTIAIIAVHNKDETLCVLEVVSPQRSDLSTERSGCQTRASIASVTSTRLKNAAAIPCLDRPRPTL